MAGTKKISEEDKNQIALEFNQGKKRKEIAEKYGISQTMVTYIIFPGKVAEMREKAAKRATEKNMNLARVQKWREKRKFSMV